MRSYVVVPALRFLLVTQVTLFAVVQRIALAHFQISVTMLDLSCGTQIWILQARDQRNMGNSCSRGPRQKTPALHVDESCTSPPECEPGSIVDTWNQICRKQGEVDAPQQVPQFQCNDRDAPRASEPRPRKFPTPIVIGAQGKGHTATVILLHGLGDTAHGWSDGWGSQLCTIGYCKWVLPTAPTVRSFA